MPDCPDPAHDLPAVQEKAKVGFVTIARGALDSAAELDFGYHEILACVMALEPADFHKSMDAENPRWSGCRQDVYRPFHEGRELYVKFQLFPGQRLHIVSFKRK